MKALRVLMQMSVLKIAVEVLVTASKPGTSAVVPSPVSSEATWCSRAPLAKIAAMANPTQSSTSGDLMLSDLIY
eukprot:g80441.t1